MRALKLISLLLPVTALLAESNAFALPSLQPKLRDKEIRVGLLGNHYLTEATESISDSRTGNLGVHVGVRGAGSRGDFQFGVEGESLYGLGEAHFRYLSISEAYVGLRPAPWSAYFGRKRFAWNNLDSYWSLGLFQPRFRWDYLNEKENGLVGFFPGYETDLVRVTGFVSGLYIPEQGAPFDIAGGECKSASPWFSCPASSIFLFNQATPVRFRLDIPPVKSLVLHPSYGGTVRVGRDSGAFGRLSYTRKPVNQLMLSFEGRLSISTLDVPAVIRPRVAFHDLYGLDAGWNFDRHSVTASGIWERPKQDYPPANWNTQVNANAFLAGLTVKTMPFRETFKFTRFEFSYLNRTGGNAPDRGPFVSPTVATFEPRYPFENAYSFAIFTPISDAWARKFLFSTKFIVDTVNQGNILVSDVFYRPWPAVITNLGLDMLGSNSARPADFISRYQRNDRVRGGISYAF